MRYVKLACHYLKANPLSFLLIPLILVFTVIETSQMNLAHAHHLGLKLHCDQVGVITLFSILILPSTFYNMLRPRSVYLVDYSCYKPPNSWKMKNKKFMEQLRLAGVFDETSLEFQSKILERSGLGEETYLPEVMHSIPLRPSIAAAREEAEQVIFGALDNLFANTNVKTEEISILVVNCSLFNPLPSLSAMIVNKYKLKDNIRSFNLGGMGCSAGVIAVDLAKHMLQIRRNTCALVVSTESLSQNLYVGNKKSMMIQNCLFRVGGSAVLLSNKSSDRSRAKYKLVHVVRTHRGADHEKALTCSYEKEDDAGNIGLSLSKELMEVAGGALKANITTLLRRPFVLPISEQLFFFASSVADKLSNGRFKTYIPDITLAFDHLCIHPGGRAVIDEVEKNLKKLLPVHLEASRMTLERFGNTSSSSTWYQWAYIEAKREIREGNRVWQIGFGSGFKCNTAVWEALQNVKSSPGNPWEDCIHWYLVQTVL